MFFPNARRYEGRAEAEEGGAGNVAGERGESATRPARLLSRRGRPTVCLRRSLRVVRCFMDAHTGWHGLQGCAESLSLRIEQGAAPGKTKHRAYVSGVNRFHQFGMAGVLNLKSVEVLMSRMLEISSTMPSGISFSSPLSTRASMSSLNSLYMASVMMYGLLP